MTGIRSTTSPPLPTERGDRAHPVSRTAVQPVHLERETEADRRRSLREELDAAAERFPPTDAGEPAADVHAVADELGRLGADALRVLQPIDAKVRRLVEAEHVDEQA